MQPTPDSAYFLELQTSTGWGRVLLNFVEWCQPRPGWRSLDVGCGPGLLPALLAQRGCQAFGVDVDAGMLRPIRLHPLTALADALNLPFASHSFELITASNLLFLLPKPELALQEMRRVLHHSGQVCLLNPSERMNLQAASDLAERSGLQGLARQTLLNWAARAEAHFRWDGEQTQALFATAGLTLVESETKMGPGLARFSRGCPLRESWISAED